MRQSTNNRLPYEDLRQASGVLPEIYAHTDLLSFPRFTAQVIHRFVAADLIEFNEVGIERRILIQQPTSPEGCRRYPIFKVHLNKHPVLSERARPDILRSARHYEAEPLFSGQRDDEFYRLLGVTDQLAIGFHGEIAAWISIVLNRWGPTFSARDRMLVEFLQPHLAQAYHHAAALAVSQQKSESLSGAFASMHRGLVLLNGSGQALWMTKRAAQWLANYFGEPAGDRRLPKSLLRWIQIRRAWQKQNGNLILPEPLIISQAQSRLFVRFSEDSRGRQFLFLKEETTGVCPSAFVRLGLTRREGEVLYWICQGKSNPEIAAVEGISSRTVHKHVEHILAKLNVETRAAAMLNGLQALDESDATGQEE